MVLAIEWLQTVDEVTFNFEKQKVKITQGQNTWEYTGVPSGTMEMVPASLMDKTLYQTAKGWVLYVCTQVRQGQLHSRSGLSSSTTSSR